MTEFFKRMDVDTAPASARSWVVRGGATERSQKESLLLSGLIHREDVQPGWWVVDLMHLRDIPGVLPAEKAYAKAEYEVAILFVHPEACPNPEPEQLTKGFPVAVPAFYVQQFHGVSDETAVRIAEVLISIVETFDPPQWAVYAKTAVDNLVLGPQ